MDLEVTAHKVRWYESRNLRTRSVPNYPALRYVRVYQLTTCLHMLKPHPGYSMEWECDRQKFILNSRPIRDTGNETTRRREGPGRTGNEAMY